MRSRCIGLGGYVPDRVLDNNTLAQTYKLDTSDEWIRQRTGILSRHIAAPNESSADMAYKASLKALEQAQIEPQDIELIVLATTTPEHVFPASATRLQHHLKAHRAFAFDVQAVCTGFVYALSIADQYIRTGFVKTALVVGSDTMSRILDWSDRSTCVLFGDGAGAVVLRGEEDNKGIVSTHLYSDGAHYDALYVCPNEKSETPRGAVYMDGNKVFMQAVRRMGEAINTALKHNNVNIDDIHAFIPHQANQRILDSLADQLNCDKSKVISTLAHFANTSAASIPLAMATAQQRGEIQLNSNQLIVLAGIGGGLTWGSALLHL